MRELVGTVPRENLWGLSSVELFGVSRSFGGVDNMVYYGL